MRVRVSDDETITHAVDRETDWIAELSNERARDADIEQERSIVDREELQSMLVGVDHHDTAVRLVDCDAGRILERTSAVAELEQERMAAARQGLHTMVVGIDDEDAVSFVVDRQAPWPVEQASLRAVASEHALETAIVGRERLHTMVAAIGHVEAIVLLIEHEARRTVQFAIAMTAILVTERELDTRFIIEEIH